MNRKAHLPMQAWGVLLGTLCLRATAQTPTATPQDNAFFEQHIRPLLVQRCYSCHAGTNAKGGLRLDSRAGWQQGGAKGQVILPGDAENSRLLKAVRHETGVAPMPPDGKLSDRERARLAEWIQKGAPDPRTSTSARPLSKTPHWAFQPLQQGKLPTVKQATWCRTPLDRFILAELERKGMKPSPEADRRTLLRRVTFDLTGLPPTPAEMEAFLQDRRPDAYARVVDRLLASPRYGERWGRHWLDVVHYGDTHGYDKDKRRDHAWPYRDYVIRALNEDKPYSRFLREQIAGDVLFPNNPDGIIATGFLAAGPWDFVGQVELAEGTVEKEKTRLLDRDDMVANAISTFNSVTIHCARCHDHKFDPIPQKDYYRLQAVFAGVERGDRFYGEDSEQATPGSPTNGYHSGIEKVADTEKWVQIDLGRVLPLERLRLLPARPTDFADTPGFGFPVRFRIQVSETPDFSNGITVADHTTADYPSPGAAPYVLPLQGQKARYLRITATQLWKRTDDYVFALGEAQVYAGGRNVARGATVTALDSIEAGRWSRRALVDGADSRFVFGKVAYSVLPRAPRPIHLLTRGEVEQPREPMGPGALSCLAMLPATFPDTAEEGQRRAALADWLASPQNPLTWRSIVNRVWGYHFGRGLVDTPNDLGRNGSRPTHPALLDWLASTFRDRGQSLKSLHRLLLLSATYRQSAQENPLYSKRDADNRLLWHQNRRRLDAEEVRDTVLTVSDSLDLTMGGPGFEPFRFRDDHSPEYDHTAPEKINDPKTWRRTVYRFTVRSVPHPFLDCLDGADPNINTPVRNTTLTALQALALLNNPFMVRQSERFAERVQRLASTPSAQVAQAFRLALSRPPTATEQTEATTYLQKYGLVNLCRLLFNANEFIFVD